MVSSETQPSPAMNTALITPATHFSDFDDIRQVYRILEQEALRSENRDWKVPNSFGDKVSGPAWLWHLWGVFTAMAIH